MKKNLDPFTSASDIEKNLIDKKKNKRTPQEKNRRDRHLQKEIVRQLTDELVELSEKDILEQSAKETNPHYKTNEVVYTIRPVNYKEE
ncbi:MAG: hypothetical protein K2Q18_00145 [Bdellovibrionales bacterium]|nr:hypothetical protein [Bdellovibrionales bacterium]